MSATVILRHARRMCRGFGSVAVAVAGNGTAPDGQPLRGLVNQAERVVDDGIGQVIERSEVLTIPTADVPTVVRGTTLTVDGRAREVRDRLLMEDGSLVELILAGL
jgi:hypothetical protein